MTVTLSTGGVIAAVSYSQTQKYPIYVMGKKRPVEFVKSKSSGIAGSITFLELPKNKVCKNQKLTLNVDGMMVKFTGVAFVDPKNMKPGVPCTFVAKKIIKSITTVPTKVVFDEPNSLQSSS